ncbi:MAG: hypothetical protein OJF58_000108 [Enhydrobacter sp.]|nr:MAG: hypothetical protein OJF58_000108 [Enhydrobacter sp.]
MPGPADGNVTIETLQRAVAPVGRKVQVEIVRRSFVSAPHERNRASLGHRNWSVS